VSVKPIRLARWLAFVVVSAVMSSLLAGRPDLPRLWLLLAVYWVVLFAGLLTIDPEVVGERLKAGQKTADPVILAGLRLGSLAELVVGIVDIGRFHWSDTVPSSLGVASAAIALAAYGFALAAVRANRYFMPSVRIQTERGHHVVDTGPYRLVRHPGYAALIVASPANGLILGSWLGFWLGVATAAIVALRAWNEDRFLQKNLAGYPEYSARTRYRLVPGVF